MLLFLICFGLHSILLQKDFRKVHCMKKETLESVFGLTRGKWRWVGATAINYQKVTRKPALVGCSQGLTGTVPYEGCPPAGIQNSHNRITSSPGMPYLPVSLPDLAQSSPRNRYSLTWMSILPATSSSPNLPVSTFLPSESHRVSRMCHVVI